MIKIQNRPDTYGYVIIYDGKYAYRPYNLNEKIPLKTYLPFFGETNYRTHQIMRHFTLRAFPSNRILFINGGIKEIYQINLWIISKGATPPKPMPTLDKMAYRKGKIEGWDSIGNCL
ncbi:MAG: hypothetical protein M3405_16050 [Acidobacteriota bacterium]|nr:hypothetical protein [Acidobacteriota bacterium]